MDLRGPQRMSSPRAPSRWGYTSVTKRSHLCGVGTCSLGPPWDSGLTSPCSTDSCPVPDAHGRPCTPAPTSAGGGGSPGSGLLSGCVTAPACPLSGSDPYFTAVHTLLLDDFTCGFSITSRAASEAEETLHVGGPGCSPLNLLLFVLTKTPNHHNMTPAPQALQRISVAVPS